MQKKVKRILIDCSFIDFSRQPTGIPRVVLKYIEVGYEWSKKSGIEVIPVLPTANGVVIVRPLPGANPPEELLARAKGKPIRKKRSFGRDLIQYFDHIEKSATQLVSAIIPAPPVVATGKWLDELFSDFTKSTESFLFGKDEDGIVVNVGPNDVILAPAYWHDVDPDIYKGLRRLGATVIILVHDLIPITMQRFYASPWRYEFKKNVLHAFDYSDRFLTVSNVTKRDLLETGLRNKKVAPPIMTAYNGYEPLVDKAEVMRLHEVNLQVGNVSRKPELELIAERRPYLMVGSIEPKKGHIPTIQCFEAMWLNGYDRNLVIIGRRGWLEKEIIACIEGSPFLGQKLHWFTNLDDFDLAQAYEFCHGLVFSSVAEGFGIPMIEAASFGKPVVVYESEIAKEVIGARGIYFRTAAGLAREVRKLEEPAVYEHARETVKGLKWPTWDEYTPRVFDAIVKSVTRPEETIEEVEKAAS